MKKLVADVYGIVQGVGFRWFVETSAGELGVEARADNREDGSVHVVAFGDRERLLQLTALLRQGGRYSAVDRVEYTITDVK